MKWSTDRARPRSSRALLALAALALSPGTARAQSLFERLGLDRLHLVALGMEAGPVAPMRTVATTAYAIHADYGEIVPDWRVVFTATYWGSRFDAQTVQRFEHQLAAATIGPAGDATVKIGTVRISDIALETDIRWSPRHSGVLRPYAGGAFGAHFVNAENKVINNTFVESALDQISAGITALGGVETAPLYRMSVGVQARYSLLSTVRFGTIRAFASYHFARARAGAPQ